MAKQNKCCICDSHASQTGSHIFSFFLIRDATNMIGRKQRSYELSFGMSSDEFIKTHFDQSILPEQIERIKKKHLTEGE